MTKLVESLGLVDSILWCHQFFLCHMTCHSQLELLLWMRNPQTGRERDDAPYTEGPWKLQDNRVTFGIIYYRYRILTSDVDYN